MTDVPEFTILPRPATPAAKANNSGRPDSTPGARRPNPFLPTLSPLFARTAAGDVEGRAVIGLGLRAVQDALNKKADSIQHEFVSLSQTLDDIGRQIVELRGGDTAALRAEQASARERQEQLAEEVNLWRQRGRDVTQQKSQTALRAYLEELATLNEPAIQTAAKHAQFLLDAPEEELDRLAQSADRARETTPAGRLLARARSAYDLGVDDPVARKRGAVEFANRQGMAQDDLALAEIEAGIQDEDPRVRDIAVLTAIQIHRFRATRVADLELSHASVKRLAAMDHAEVVPILIEILEKPRTGFVDQGGVSVESDNGASRMLALLRLVEWHSADVQKTFRALQFDQDPKIVQAAAHALELFPDPWKGPLPAKSA